MLTAHNHRPKKGWGEQAQMTGDEAVSPQQYFGKHDYPGIEAAP